MKRDFSEVAQFTRVVPTLGADNHLLKYREKAFYEKEVVYVDSTFFDVFSYHFVDGSPSRALEAPYSIVLMRPIAVKLFGKEDPVGKTILIDDGYGKNNFKVTAVIDESLGKTTIKANLFITMNSGRDFRRTDSGKVLINEAMAKRLGINPETASGTKLYQHYEPNPETYVEVVGVMKDFNYNSLRTEVKPFMLEYDSHNEDMPYVVTASNTTDYQTLLGKMGAIWNKDFPGTPFEYNFLDAQIQKQYESEITFGRIINSFTLVAILISCLGLFGLAAFSAEQRIKEIGIRKVLGAGVPGIVRLLSRDFLRLVLVSIVMATPIAWWVMDKWLQSFVYRVPLSWWMFALAGLLAVFIALFTVSFQAIKAAVANPVKSLRAD